MLTKALLDRLQQLMIPDEGEPVAPNLVGESVGELLEEHMRLITATFAEHGDPRIEAWLERVAGLCESLASELVAEPGKYM